MSESGEAAAPNVMEEGLLTKQAINGALEEIEEIEHSVQMWTQRSRKILEELTALLTGSSSSRLSSTVCQAALSKLKQGEELDKLLQGVAAFPASLEHYVQNIAPSQESSGAGAGPKGEEERAVVEAVPAEAAEHKKGFLQIRQTQSISGAQVVTEFVRYWSVLRGGELALYNQEGDAAPQASILLRHYTSHAPDDCLPASAPGLRQWKLTAASGGGGAEGSGRWLLGSLGATVSYLSAWSSSGGGKAAREDGAVSEYDLRAESAAAAAAWILALAPHTAPPPPPAPAPPKPSPSLFSLSFSSAAAPSQLELADGHAASQPWAEAGEGQEEKGDAEEEEEEEEEGLDAWGVLQALARGPKAERAGRLTERLAAVAAAAPRAVEPLLPQLANLAMEGEDVTELERLLFALCADNIHIASLLAWTLRSAMGGVAEAQQAPSLLSRATGKGGKESGARSRLLEVYSRLMLGVELAVVDGKRLGSPESAADFIARASTALCQGEKRLRALHALPDDLAALEALGGGGAVEAAWERVQRTRALRRDLFFKEHGVVEELCELSSALRLVPKGAGRDQRLRERLRELNLGLPSGAYLPLCGSEEAQLALLRLPEQEALCLSTYDKTPFILYAEALALPHPVGDTHCVVHSPALLRRSLQAHGLPLHPPAQPQPQPDLLGSAAAGGEGGEEEMKEMRPAESTSPDPAEPLPVPTASDSTVPEQPGEAADGSGQEMEGEGLLGKVFGERWEQRQRRLREKSPYGAHPDWRLAGVIVKADDDIRQEQFAMQLMREVERIWAEGSLSLRLRTYSILSTAPSAGLIEMIPDVISMATLRRRHAQYTSLAKFFQDAYGAPDTPSFQAAQQNFVCSMAAYSIVTYILQIKDRHDGNILLERDGGIAHIDFGFMLGRRMNDMVEFEKAPFKLTQDHVDVMMLGACGACYQQYLALCIKGYLLLRKHAGRILTLVKAMQAGSPLPCLEGGQQTITELEERLGVGKTEGECVDSFIQLRDASLQCWRTGAYDMLQKVLGVY